MSDHPDTSIKLIQQAVEKYSEVSALRASVQLIPYIGGPLDTLIGGEGQKIQQRRISHFIEELDKRLSIIEVPQRALELEVLYDLMMNTLDRVAKSRSVEKRKCFAEIISHEISTANNIDDAEQAIRLISELENIHIEILRFAIRAPACKAFDNIKIISISSNSKSTFAIPDNVIPVITNIFPNIPKTTLSLICSELVSKGLLRDAGVTRPFLDSVMEYFVATDLATWLFSWINE